MSCFVVHQLRGEMIWLCILSPFLPSREPLVVWGLQKVPFVSLYKASLYPTTLCKEKGRMWKVSQGLNATSGTWEIRNHFWKLFWHFHFSCICRLSSFCPLIQTENFEYNVVVRSLDSDIKLPWFKICPGYCYCMALGKSLSFSVPLFLYV